MSTCVSNPQSVFVWKDQVLFVDFNNHRVRKILPNGSTVTIAGTGVKGYNGDEQFATSAQLDHPYCVVVSERGEVYIAEEYRVRKILTNGMIITVAGTGMRGYNGYNGDDILGTYAQLYYPSYVFVSNSGEVFISEYYGHRIRKIDSNGINTTIAGDGKSGYASDVAYIHAEHGILGRLVSCDFSEGNIMKHERDCLYSSNVIGFLPILELISPQFTKNVLNENFISKLDSKEQVVQQLIDSILYDPEKVIEYDTIEDSLRFLFILNHACGEFLNLKRNLVTSFVENLQVNNVFDSLTIIDRYLDRSMGSLIAEDQNFLSKMKEFCFDYIAKSVQKPNCTLIEDVRLNKYSMNIFRAMGMVSLNKSLLIFEKPFQNFGNLEQLFNDKKTSDVKIKMKDSFSVTRQFFHQQVNYSNPCLKVIHHLVIL